MNPSRFTLAVLILISYLFLAGFFSSTSKPNPSIIDSGFDPGKNAANENFAKARGLLAELAKKNLSLATELGRLPEVQEANAASIPEALQRLVRLYEENPDAFQKTLDRMLSVGLPRHRRYNTPLQALFWLAEDKKMNAARRMANEYELIDLLRAAWVKEDMINQSQDAAVVEKHKKRWGDFDVVIDRLNSPELIDYYEKRYFKYGFNRSKDTSDSYAIFLRKEGNCVDYANFTYRCLSWAGYHSWKEMVPGHETVIIKGSDGKYYALDNARRMNKKPIGLAGPFDEVGELKLKLRYY
jgi:hypothetical protein